MSAFAPLVSVIISTLFVYITRADKKGVAIVSIIKFTFLSYFIYVLSFGAQNLLFQVTHIDKGVNPSSASEIFFSGKYVGAGIRIGVIAGLIALTVCC